MNYGSNIMKLLLPNAHKGMLLLLVNIVSSNKPLLNNNFKTINVQCVLRQESKLLYKAALMLSCLLNHTLMQTIHTER
jgi:hypothetical protein